MDANSNMTITSCTVKLAFHTNSNKLNCSSNVCSLKCKLLVVSSPVAAHVRRAAGLAFHGYGVVFALILLNSCLERKEGEIPLTFVLTGALWLGRELGIAKAGVASSAHLVGAAVGTFFGHKMYVRRTWLGGSERKFED